MLSIPILDNLRSLRLYGILKSYQEQTESSEYADLSFEERFGLMIDREVTEQENKRLNSRLRRAKLRQQACMENIDYRAPRGLDKSLMKRWLFKVLNG